MLLFIALASKAQEIFDAVNNGDLAKIKELVKKDPQMINARNPRQSTPLIVAASLDNEEIAKYLIEKGADILAINVNNFTPLSIAGIKVAQLLVEKGADINMETANGTALRRALLYGKKDVADFLIDNGAKIPDKSSQWYNSMLSDALEGGCIKYLEKCFEKGLNPSFELETKSNLLHLAAAGKSVEIINRLIRLGVKIDQRNIYGLTPLHIAVLKSNKNIVELFITIGLDKNERTADGKSPYNLAVEANQIEIIEYLKLIGADQSQQKYPLLKGKYLGQKEPGKTNIPFAPGIVVPFSNFHSSIVFSPDGMEAYWGTMGMGLRKMSFENEQWSKPDTVKFVSFDDSPTISPDGKNMFFLARSSVPGNENRELIYVKEKTKDGWSEPKPLPDNINSIPGLHWMVSTDLKGNLYFGARQNGGITSRIYYSAYNNGNYSNPEVIEELKETNAHSPYIAPDGSYLIYTTASDFLIKIRFRSKDGKLGKEISLKDITGPQVQCPFVSYDGKYLFYLHYVGDRFIPYWVDASFIEDLKKEALKD